MFTFKYVSGHYEVFLDGEKVDTFATGNINQAIADFKEKNNKNRR